MAAHSNPPSPNGAGWSRMQSTDLLPKTAAFRNSYPTEHDICCTSSWVRFLVLIFRTSFTALRTFAYRFDIIDETVRPWTFFMKISNVMVISLDFTDELHREAAWNSRLLRINFATNIYPFKHVSLTHGRD